MRIDKNLVAIHAYLCADGYVTTSNKWKYYRIGLRNTNEILLKDFQQRFDKVFGVKPIIRKDGRCEKNSKEIYELLTKRFGSFYSRHWKMPPLNKKLIKIWLRSYFDCEGWVFCKHHQNRHIGIDCINEKGLNQIIKSLNKLGIKTIKKNLEKRNIFRILIYGKKNLEKFQNEIGFLHPDKKEKLNEIMKNFVEYKWNFPLKEKENKLFIKKLLKEKIRIKKPYFIRIISKERKNLIKLQILLMKYYSIYSIIRKSKNGLGKIYYELNINRKREIQKLIDLKIIKNIFKLN